MNGIINVLKPPGMSSNGVTVYLRGLLGEKRCGHAGTLDPGAAGVLPVLTGRTAKLSEYLMNAGKEYVAEFFFGIATDTLDSYGVVTEEKACSISEEAFKEALSGFAGEITQTPPAYSAVKTDGVASYKLARQGKTVIKPQRRVNIYEAEYMGSTGENRFLVRVRCSKGTYIRVIAEDIGRKLGVPAHMSFLLRTSAGGLDINDSYTLDEIADMKERGDLSFLMPPETAHTGLDTVSIPGHRKSALINGLETASEGSDGEYMLYCGECFLGIGRRENGSIKLKTAVFDITEE